MWLLILLLLTGIANADVYVLTDTNNNVIGLSDQNDMVIPKGDKVIILKNQIINNLPITGDPTMYTLNGNSFVLNTDKVKSKQAADAQAIADQTARDNAKASAIAKLKAVGLTDDEIKAIAR